MQAAMAPYPNHWPPPPPLLHIPRLIGPLPLNEMQLDPAYRARWMALGPEEKHQQQPAAATTSTTASSGSRGGKAAAGGGKASAGCPCCRNRVPLLAPNLTCTLTCRPSGQQRRRTASYPCQAAAAAAGERDSAVQHQSHCGLISAAAGFSWARGWGVGGLAPALPFGSSDWIRSATPSPL